MREIIEEYLSAVLVLIATFVFIGVLPMFASRINHVSEKVINTQQVVESKDLYEDFTGGKPIKSLSIDGIAYDYEEGMSWNEWLNSSYNTDDYTILVHPCTNEEYLGKYTVQTVR